MSIRPPSTDQLRALADQLHLDLSETELDAYRSILSDTLSVYEAVDDYDEPSRYEPQYPRDPAGSIDDLEDPHNAWITTCRVRGADSGPLAGVDVAIKDNVPVAGVEMTCGSAVVSGFVPTIDPPVVTRLLDAGATIVGKTNMDDMASSGDGSHSAFGPVLNPHDTSHLAGGSSGGSAVAVATGDADLALGTDQGGSIRAPAAWSGVVGYKPTHGLVPYTGAIGLEPTVDHIGPMATDVETVATALSVIAGRDPGDPRQPHTVPTSEYESALQGEADTLSIAVVEEGFDRPDAEAEVGDRVNAALETLANAGATVERVSIPEHADGQAIHIASLAEAFLAMIEGDGYGHTHAGWYDTQWIDAFAAARRRRGSQFPPGFAITALLGAYVGSTGHDALHGKAMNLRQRLVEAYNERLDDYDLLAMPTTPMRAYEHDPNKGLEEYAGEAFANLANTAPFNATGHPSVSVPVPADGLPVGLMLTGGRFDDETVLDGAYTVERLLDA